MTNLAGTPQKLTAHYCGLKCEKYDDIGEPDWSSRVLFSKGSVI